VKLTDEERADRAQEVIEQAINSYLDDLPDDDEPIDTGDLAENIRRELERSGVKF
jgi:hypothetical protein